MYFTLTEAILQLTSSIFTVLNLPLTSSAFSTDTMGDDIEFLMYNSFSDVGDVIGQSSEYYVSELIESQKTK